MSDYSSFSDALEKGAVHMDPATRVNQVMLITNQSPLADVLDPDDFHLAGKEAKRRIFRNYLQTHIAQQNRGVGVLSLLKQVAPSIAQKFSLKPDLIDAVPFKLWAQRETPDMQEDSYVALSYCWDPKRRPSPPSSTDGIPLPISPLMFSALAMERQWRTTGIWVDQLCIDQNSGPEKARSVASMDVIYRSAQVVVVALMDVEISVAQQEFLRAFIPDYESPEWDPRIAPHAGEQPPIFEKCPILASILHRVLASRWFTRAWCSHEMECGENFVFYAPCKSSTPSEPATQMLAFSANFFWDVLSLSAEVPSFGIPIDLRDRLMTVFNFKKRVVRFLDKHKGAKRDPSTEESSIMSYSAQARDSFALGAGGNPDLPEALRYSSACLDKTSIVLNVLGTGIAVVPEQNSALTESECMKRLIILGLCAGDPTALCTTGVAFDFSTTSDRTSWLAKPSYWDLGSGVERGSSLKRMSPRLLQRLSIDESPDCHWIQLDVFGLGEPILDFQRHVDVAAQVIAKAKSLGLGQTPLPPELKSSLITDKGPVVARFTKMIAGLVSGWGAGRCYEHWDNSLTAFGDAARERFSLTLACLIECGPSWALNMAIKCGYPQPPFIEPKLTAATGVVDFSHLEDMKWAETQIGRDAVNALLCISMWMIAWVSKSPIKTEFMPVIYQHGVRGGKAGKAVVYIFTDALPQVVVPMTLIDDDYRRLYRVWLLQAKDDPLYEKMMRGEGAEWFLRGKSLLFTDMDQDEGSFAFGSAREANGAWVVRPEVKVHGPPSEYCEESAPFPGGEPEPEPRVGPMSGPGAEPVPEVVPQGAPDPETASIEQGINDVHISVVNKSEDGVVIAGMD